jgi:parallel beta helix pectate lyase-like protein
MKPYAAVLLVVLALIASPALAAGLFRAYVSSTGNDANDCSLPHPCRLLPKALSAVASGGEIWMLDSANYNTAQVNIDRSVTILAIPGALGSVVATGGGDAIFVGTAGIKVTLRNLVIVRLGSGNDGVGINQASDLDVEDCEISNMGGSGIAAFDAAAKVRVASTRLRGNNNGFYARGTVIASLESVTSVGNATAGIYADTASTVNVANSTLRNNANGVYAIGATVSVSRTQSDANATGGILADSGSRLVAHDSSFANNGVYAVLASASSAGLETDVAVLHSSATGGSFGFRVSAVPGSESLMAIDGNQCVSCGDVFSAAKAGGNEFFFTAGNNSTVFGDAFSGTLVPNLLVH